MEMEDKNIEIQTNRKISRRDFLKLAGLAGAALLLSRCRPPIPSTSEVPLPSEEEAPTPDLRERFSKLGMSDFYDFHKQCMIRNKSIDQEVMVTSSVRYIIFVSG